jgi:outer membrane cobalamin receptor
LNYSRRIDRPGGRQLDPFPDYSDPQNIRAGNPELEPEYIDSYELNFQQQFSKSFVSIETYYRRTNNLITNVSYLLEDNVLYRTYENMNHDNAIGIEFNANLFLNKWWRLNASGSGFYYQILGQISGEDISTESFNWNLRFDNSFSFKSNTKVQITGFYNAPSVTVQGKTEGFFFSNLAVRQDLMKGNLTITAQLQDIFGSMGHHFSETTDTYSTVTNFSREARVVTLALTYRLNNYKQKRNGEGREDMEMDMDMGI